jgi:hypothetical protein
LAKNEVGQSSINEANEVFVGGFDEKMPGPAPGILVG